VSHESAYYVMSEDVYRYVCVCTGGGFHLRCLVAHCRGSTVEQLAGPPSGTSRTHPPATMVNLDSISLHHLNW